MRVVKEAPLCVQFDGVVVGEFAADLYKLRMKIN